ncbi:Bbp16 family capsid cement protein [Achromobacter pestifer]|uniref:Uncharacterized protein n=1 Tax=Achromobacter pestifer TaxID=1353889 RepID=A0A6S6YIT3_9BURK|nr:hypothetical protein [Achromobacter pestifer]CAB3624671.1 hypothetical protein LMG3431_00050 [Achromobacter pestifer]
MILDTQETFSEGQSIAAAAGDVVSTNVYDTGAAHDVGIGEPLYLTGRIGTAVAGVGATVQAVLQTDDNVGFSSPREFPITGAVGVASLGANAGFFNYRLPVGLERYLRIVYRVAGATTTAGTVSAYIVKDVQANVSYASGFTVA